jgi:hypothetical protein
VPIVAQTLDHQGFSDDEIHVILPDALVSTESYAQVKQPTGHYLLDLGSRCLLVVQLTGKDKGSQACYALLGRKPCPIRLLDLPGTLARRHWHLPGCRITVSGRHRHALSCIRIVGPSKKRIASAPDVLASLAACPFRVTSKPLATPFATSLRSASAPVAVERSGPCAGELHVRVHQRRAGMSLAVGGWRYLGARAQMLVVDAANLTTTLQTFHWTPSFGFTPGQAQAYQEQRRCRSRGARPA